MSRFKTIENDYVRAIQQGYQVDFSHTLGDFDSTGRPGLVSVRHGFIDSNGQRVDSWPVSSSINPDKLYTEILTMDTESSAVVVDLAKDMIESMRKLDPAWERSFFRFRIEEFRYGSNASYVREADVFLIDPFEDDGFFDRMNEKSRSLFKQLNKKEGVLLLIANSLFDYEVKFEFEDLDRWQISKLNNGTGMPEGI
jgi:hypothetical protein